MVRVYCVGDNNVDIYLHTGTVYPGGSCVNVAAAVSQCGHKAAFVSTVGNDRLGDLQADSLRAVGVDVSHLHRIDAQTPWCFITVKDGERIFGRNCVQARRELPISVEDVRRGQNGEWDLLYTCSDAFYAPGAIEQFGRSDYPAVCDFTTRWTEESLREGCRHFSHPYLSCEQLTEAQVQQLLGRCVDEWGAKLAVGTMGMRGSMVYNGRKFYRQKAYPVQTVDTLGAGDSFLATFTVCYFDGLKLLRSWQTGEQGIRADSEGFLACEDRLIEKSLAFAALRAARTCQDYGGFGHGITFEKEMIDETAI